MSLDNVLAIAAVAEGSWFLLTLGLAVSIPLVIVGASLIMALIERLPIVVWFGAALLGWVAGEMLLSDPWLVGLFGQHTIATLTVPGEIVGAVLVLVCGAAMRRRDVGSAGTGRTPLP
jgi:predicted tellurium resistance membrane protein TerC